MQNTSRNPSSIFASCRLVGVVFLTVAQVSPPAPQPVDAPATEFSAGRAMKGLEVIAREPYPMGASPAHQF